ncbi:glycoside hydrolase family 2 protein [Cohnella sp. GCM10027633]|uniref:glycoside hydrolase family 2 protein n=1 Tax=unclassified Cohnella TaxID=2636738 RepID=UPI00362B2954
MIRLFEQHRVRKQKELEGLWDFAPVDAIADVPDAYPYRLPVPGCWESHPDFLRYRGRGVYRTTVTVAERSALRLVFKGVSHTAHVYWDGELIADHYNAYTAFEAIVRNAMPGEHELRVHVDNTFGEHSGLHIPNDYRTYGGIIRPVAAESLPDLWIERLSFTPKRAPEGWEAEIAVWIRNGSDRGAVASVRGELAGLELDFGEIPVPAGGTASVSRAFAFPGAEPWSHERPKLYALEARLHDGEDDRLLDDLIERVGFRSVRVAGDRLLVNEKPVVLRGFNRHEDHASVGAALPLQLMAQDIDWLERLGCNCVRTSHYPNDERFLDMCDERGLYVWEESHARSLTLEQMSHPKFASQSEDCIREMVEQHRNHPSIVVWGLLNECASNTEEGRTHFEAQFRQLRGLDGSRPLTYASCHVFADRCLDLADIVSFNLYPGWYNPETVEEFYGLLRPWVDANGGAGKPFLVSEFGGEAPYGFRDPGAAKWSEEYQAKLMGESLDYYLSRPEICGTLVWQFGDNRVDEEFPSFASRAGNRNNKGVFDAYRRPKLAVEAIRTRFEAAAAREPERYGGGQARARANRFYSQ